MSRYLFAALSIALFSVIMAVAVLSGLYGVNPLNMEIVSESRIATSIADRAAAIAAIATISVAISTVLALIVGTTAVIAVIITNSSEAKTIEQLKVDIASVDFNSTHSNQPKHSLYKYFGNELKSRFVIKREERITENRYWTDGVRLICYINRKQRKWTVAVWDISFSHGFNRPNYTLT